MGLFDWLLTDEQRMDDARRRAKSGRVARVPVPGQDPMTVCAVCQYVPESCRCDPELGRPRRWWE